MLLNCLKVIIESQLSIKWHDPLYSQLCAEIQKIFEGFFDDIKNQ